MVHSDLLKLLVCPEDKSALTMADTALIERINETIAADSLKNRSGEAVTEPIQGGLVREDGQFLYLIRDDIPVMLIDEAIPLNQLQ